MKGDTEEKLILDLQAMQTRAHALRMPSTARALNAAMNAAGWELADKIAEAKRIQKAGDA